MCQDPSPCDLDQLALVTPRFFRPLTHNIDRHVSGDRGKVFLEANETHNCTVGLVPFGSPARKPTVFASDFVGEVKGRAE
jgi:hypothetical protein